MNPLSMKHRTYLIVWPDMEKEGGIQVLVKDMTERLLEEGASVAVVCDAGSYSKSINQRAEVFDLKKINDLTHVKSFLEKGNFEEIRIVAFNATSAALGAVLMRHAAKSGIQAKVIAGAYHPRTFIENGSKTPLGLLSRMIAIGLGCKSIYFMNEDCRSSHAAELSFSFVTSKVIFLPVLGQRPRWRTRERSNTCEIRVISIGRITSFKAYNFCAKKIVKKLLEDGIKVIWDIYGWGEDEERLRSHLKGQDSVRFLGKLSSSSFENVVVNYDLFVGMGMSAVRSSQVGIPTVLAMESHGDLCLGYSYQAPKGNVGEVPTNIECRSDIYQVINNYSSLPSSEVDTISRKCVQWSQQFEYDGFIRKLDSVFEESRYASRIQYVVGARLLLFMMSAKRSFSFFF